MKTWHKLALGGGVAIIALWGLSQLSKSATSATNEAGDAFGGLVAGAGQQIQSGDAFKNTLDSLSFGGYDAFLGFLAGAGQGFANFFNNNQGRGNDKNQGGEVSVGQDNSRLAPPAPTPAYVAARRLELGYTPSVLAQFSAPKSSYPVGIAGGTAGQIGVAGSSFVFNQGAGTTTVTVPNTPVTSKPPANPTYGQVLASGYRSASEWRRATGG